MPLDNFASSSPALPLQASPILAICIADEATRGTKCYVYSTCLSGSKACEHLCQDGISEETTLFVKEMKQYSSTGNKGAVHSSEQTLGMTAASAFSAAAALVDATLTITSNDAKMNTWIGFRSEGKLYLKGNGWEDMDIRESVVAALDLAEERLECDTVYLCLEKNNSSLEKLVRTLMYAGFSMVHPDVLPSADPKYLVLGMEL
ncbi:hypothetical protein BGW38_005090 [Lunasporangiospora selenospora]|uniref:Ornithine decarboxylase antizyme n=1 Tax=Lunasporangiospora selenospora TaxID=979761 RepID=A0A9P6KBR2_9FUNG|nr:hypothetical protein BGW38_005090 [Lunasporangiospora selenospora]